MTAYKVLIIGGDSHIGRAVARQLEQSSCEVITTTRRKSPPARTARYLDLSKPLNRWEPPRVDACLLAGAVTSLQYCREHPQVCERVNVSGTLQLAAKLHEQGAYVLFLSSNQVFDGLVPKAGADLPVRPVTLYGQHKALVETQLLNWDNACAILRMSKVLDGANGLLHSWRSQLRQDRRIQAFDDYVMAPVSTDFVSGAIAWLLRNKVPGILQLSGERDVTYYETAKTLAAALEKPNLVDAASARDSNLLEHVPAHTTLDCVRLEKQYGQVIPSSQLTIELAIRDLISEHYQAPHVPHQFGRSMPLSSSGQ